MMLSRSRVLALAYAGAIGGYPLLAALLSLLNINDSRMPAIVLRVCVAAMAALAIWLNRRSLRIYSPVFSACFLLFWTLYLYRIVMDGYVQQIRLPFPPLELLAMALLFALLPATAGVNGLNQKSNRRAFHYTLAIFYAAMVLTLVNGQAVLSQLGQEGLSRFQLERLNPIAVGMVGGAVLLMSLASVFTDRRDQSALNRGFYLVTFCAGLFTLLIAASRGPILAAGFASLVFLLSPATRTRLAAGTAAAIFILALSSTMHEFILDAFSFDVYERFERAAEGIDGSANSRKRSFEGAFAQFLDSPLFGDSIVERTSDYYPHNAYLEALMATGLPGGLAYLAAMALAFVAARRLIARKEGYEWLALLCIFYMGASQFSGAHFGLGQHWLTMLAVVVTERKTRPASGKASPPASRLTARPPIQSLPTRVEAWPAATGTPAPRLPATAERTAVPEGRHP